MTRKNDVKFFDTMTTSEDDFCANKAYTHLEPCEVCMSAMWHAHEKTVRDVRVWRDVLFTPPVAS